MPAHSKVQDMAEALRWLEQGRAYQWCVDAYRRKYNVETTISTCSGLRRRHGIAAATAELQSDSAALTRALLGST